MFCFSNADNSLISFQFGVSLPFDLEDKNQPLVSDILGSQYPSHVIANLEHILRVERAIPSLKTPFVSF